MVVISIGVTWADGLGASYNKIYLEVGLGASIKVWACVHFALGTIVVFGSNLTNLGAWLRGSRMNAEVENGCFAFCVRYWDIVALRWGKGAEIRRVCPVHESVVIPELRFENRVAPCGSVPMVCKVTGLVRFKAFMFVRTEG